MARFSAILVSVLAVGTKPALLLAMLSLCTFSHCKTSAKQQDQELEFEEDGYEDSEYEEDAEGSEEYAGTLAHPESNTAFSTRALVSESNLPDAQALATCKEDISVIGATALNLKAMADAETEALNLVQSNVELYHWCFYVSMVHLDLKLAKTRDTLESVSNLFFSRMRSLWILARALDKGRDTNRYFSYLRDRYLQLSRDYFGRELEIQGPSAVELETAEKRAITGPSQKAAGPAPVDMTEEKEEANGY